MVKRNKAMTTKANNNGMTNKQVRCFVNGIYSINFSTISGCIKTFVEAVKVAKISDMETTANECGITKQQAVKLFAFCKDRNRVMNACLKMFPNIDNVLCEYKVVSRKYLQKEKAEKSFDYTKELKDSMLLGKVYKPYGVKPIVELLPNDVAYIMKDTDITNTVYAPFKIEYFTVKKVIKAICDYITYCEKNGLDWNKKESK